MIRRLAILSAAVLACGPEPETAIPESGADLATLTVQAESLTATMPVEGTVQAHQRAEITTRMMARIASLPVDVGARVAQGQVLVRLGVEDVAANRAKAQAAVTAARAARDEAARHAARMDTLFAQDVVAEVQRDQARLHLTQAESQLQLASATQREVEAAASYAVITAPFPGVVVARHADAGDVAAPGVPILVLESNGRRQAVLAVPPEVAERLDRDAAVTVRDGNGRATEAPIVAIAGGADPWTRTVEVKAQLPADWPTGTSVTALVPTGSFEGVAIPAGAVVRRGQLTGVNVVTSAGNVLRWVRLGRTVDGGERVHVLSGLEPGDRIVP
ncbi:MAG: efflux RND transporter periplasmic adaptor subunit [Gemmatimonadales bacterium]|jgi:RND family efflux transporter MFP subunit